MSKQRRKAIRSYLLATVATFMVFTVVTPLHSAEYQDTYPIEASNVKQLLAAIRENSTNPDGAIGYTELDTHVGWTALVDGDGTCTIETVEFTYDITINMPDWTNKHTAKQCLQDNWDTVWYEIQIHEEQHRNLYRLLDTHDINQRIAAIKPKNSCDALEAAIKMEIEKILAANDKLHDIFHASSPVPTLWDC